jgi:hypothetical protein
MMIVSRLERLALQQRMVANRAMTYLLPRDKHGRAPYPKRNADLERMEPPFKENILPVRCCVCCFVS